MEDGLLKQIDEIAQSYIEDASKEVSYRFDNWRVDPDQNFIYEVVTALLSRQLTLCLYLVDNPVQWSGHIAPIYLRCMMDVYINLSWILQEPKERARNFFLYGLGQENLHMEQRKAYLKESGLDENDDPVLKSWELWISTHRYPWLTEINVGHWAEKSTRSLAEEAGCLGAYRLSYTPFSAAVHSSWSHVLKYNLKTCNNPLHGNHLAPVLDPFIDTVISFHYCELAAKYLDKTLGVFDQKFNIDKLSAKSAYEQLLDRAAKLNTAPEFF